MATSDRIIVTDAGDLDLLIKRHNQLLLESNLAVRKVGKADAADIEREAHYFAQITLEAREVKLVLKRFFVDNFGYIPDSFKCLGTTWEYRHRDDEFVPKHRHLNIDAHFKAKKTGK